MNGAIYLCRAVLVAAKEASLYGDCTAAYVMPSPFGISIDDENDWIEAEIGASAIAEVGARGAGGASACQTGIVGCAGSCTRTAMGRVGEEIDAEAIATR